MEMKPRADRKVRNDQPPSQEALEGERAILQRCRCRELEETRQKEMRKDLLDTSSESDLSHLHPHLQDVLDRRHHRHLPSTSKCGRNRLDYDKNARSPISDQGAQSGNIPQNHIHRPLLR
jgi:hypothetical protein